MKALYINGFRSMWHDFTRISAQRLRNQQPQIEWKNIIGIRNIITHTYFSVDDEIVWNIIQTKLDPLKTAIELIQQNENLDT